MYLIIDENYRVYQAKTLSAKIGIMCKKGEISIIKIRNEKSGIKLSGMNTNQYMKDNDCGEWSNVSDVSEMFID